MYCTGATIISKLLMDKRMIQVLDINYNVIHDDGITAIATALTNSKLKELWVNGCGITLTGVRSLATLLSVNRSTAKLWLHGDFITTEGAHLLQSAVNNEAYQVDIRIDAEYKSDSEVQKMMNILENRRRMKTHMVSYLMWCMIVIVMVIINNRSPTTVNS